MDTEFEVAAGELAAHLGPGQLRTVADGIAAGLPREAVLASVPVPGFAGACRRVLDACRAGGATDAEAAAYLRGLADARARLDDEVSVESVWSGPSSNAVPVRATAQVLQELVREAGHELALMTYSAKPYAPLLEELRHAVLRGVSIMVVVETLEGAGSALAGQEPAAAFAEVPGVEVWHWPVGDRPNRGAKMHAKLAVADRRALLVSSANLTQSGVDRNMEAGLLIRGGTAPRRAAEHVAELRARGVLARLC